jgi:hypothetical protein
MSDSEINPSKFSLARLKNRIWYERLEGRYTYDQACDLFEYLLPATSASRKEKV